MEHLIDMYQDFIRNFFKMNLFYKPMKILKMNLKIVKQKVSTLVVVRIIIYQIVNLIKVGPMRVMDFRNTITSIHLLMHMMVQNVIVRILKEMYYCIHIHVNGLKNSIKQSFKAMIGLKYRTN